MASDHTDGLAQQPAEPIGSREATDLRTFTIAEGIMMLVLGSLALLFPMVASVWVTAFVSLAFLVAGLISWINTMGRARQLAAQHTFWRLVIASMLVVSGIWMVTRLGRGPAAAASQVSVLALAVGVVFVVEGLVASLVTFSHRHVRGWAWGMINGLLTLSLGILLLSMKSFNRPWILGVLVGISFLISGIDLLSFGVSFHSENFTSCNRGQYGNNRPGKNIS